MPPTEHDLFHKALASDIRRQLLLTLKNKSKYLSEIAKEINKPPQTVDFHLRLLEEIGILGSEWKEGKKYYTVKEKKILDFIERGKAIPAGLRPKPPHEIVIDMWEDMKKRLDRIEKLLESLKRK